MLPFLSAGVYADIARNTVEAINLVVIQRIAFGVIFKKAFDNDPGLFNAIEPFAITGKISGLQPTIELINGLFKIKLRFIMADDIEAGNMGDFDYKLIRKIIKGNLSRIKSVPDQMIQNMAKPFFSM